MRKGILLISHARLSPGGLGGLGLSTHYCAAKHGVIGLTKALASEVGDHNILVNAVCPGTVETGILEGLSFQAGMAGDSPYRHFSKSHILRDVKIQPSHIAQAVKWLALDDKGVTTGTILSVDAGWTGL